MVLRQITFLFGRTCLSLVGLIVIVATIVDYNTRDEIYLIKKRALWKRIFLSISAINSYRRLSSETTFDERLKFIYGVRFWSLFWVIYAHTYMTMNILTVGNTIKL